MAERGPPDSHRGGRGELEHVPGGSMLNFFFGGRLNHPPLSGRRSGLGRATVACRTALERGESGAEMIFYDIVSYLPPSHHYRPLSDFSVVSQLAPKNAHVRYSLGLDPQPVPQSPLFAKVNLAHVVELFQSYKNPKGRRISSTNKAKFFK